MGLVDYSSSSGDEAQQESPPTKRRKTSAERDGHSMPPLPSSFHDLYASTVRQSVVDDPSLHQGRKRLNPHVIGNWPTHIYVEWHPSKTQHDTINALIEKTQRQIGEDFHLHSFLTSDLGTDLPLHISLSKPLSLPTSSKGDFLSKTEDAIYASGIAPFSVKPAGLAWHKSPESDRMFFVLRVVTTNHITTNKADGKKSPLKLSTNPELMALLVKCNKIATHFRQPPLYQQTRSESVDSAFHISIGWTLGSPDEGSCLKALDNFTEKEFRDIHTWKIETDGVKAKIGNVITHIPLSSTGRGNRDARRSADSLFGM
ncbi:poly(U)-specific 3'-to-5' RNA exonuclease [Conoideocrella luteorostrata]|uniref:U6 snRNA phosphodiesterase n=1 Tax=Conoideocrella luteorostrata TaxID=1105319 RepID=A0AAJ0CM79_9HYPO|nr:poly(U)-specific 3'-to-5' RNA exonuclease [Conoideocrella luteorostrata]